MVYNAIMEKLQSMRDPKAIEGMGRYGIRPQHNLGISVTTLRGIAKEIGKDHELALELWDSGIRDARILATLIGEPGKMTEAHAEQWVTDFDSWDVCDGACNTLLSRTDMAYDKALAWSEREEEFVKRAGFTLMATLAVHWKKAEDEEFEPFFKAIVRESGDERNFVKKAVNWALRGIGKRNLELNRKAVLVAEEIEATGTRSGRWIAKDALRELTSDKVRERLAQKEEMQVLRSRKKH